MLVLMDLGSAVLSAELALDMLGDGRERVRLTAAPLVEGAVAAAVSARRGAARRGRGRGARGAAGKTRTSAVRRRPGRRRRLPRRELERGSTLPNRLGLHARPAARFVETVGRFDAAVRSRTATGRGPASGRSLNAIATLGARQGQELLVSAGGPEAEQRWRRCRAGRGQLRRRRRGPADRRPRQRGE